MVDTAVIMAAGYGTRFLPATKNVPKEMLPLIDVPILHEVVKECIDSGIKKIVIVTRHGNNAVEDYFDNNKELEDYLDSMGKLDRYERFKEVFNKAEYAYVRQNRSMPYGNGSPLLAAKPFLTEGNPFAVLFGDDLVLAEEGGLPGLKQSIDLFEGKVEAIGKVGGVVMCSRVSDEEVHKYGIVKFRDGTADILDRLIEKPDLKDSPSNFAEFGRFVLSWDVFKYLNPDDTGKDGELWTADAVDDLAQESPVFVKELEGKWLTTGDPANMLRTTIEYALRRPELRKGVINAIKDSLMALEK